LIWQRMGNVGDVGRQKGHVDMPDMSGKWVEVIRPNEFLVEGAPGSTVVTLHQANWLSRSRTDSFVVDIEELRRVVAAWDARNAPPRKPPE